MSDENGSRDATKLIVAINSQKGGVGKTTIALKIAHEALVNSTRNANEYPVVLIDADIFGTELADLLDPYSESGSNSGGKRWDLGLVDLLAQSTGGGSTIREHVTKKLTALLNGRTTMPCIPLCGESKPKLLLIPSLTERRPWKRPVDTAPSLEMSAVIGAMGKLQLELRMTALVDAVIVTLKPDVILIDNAPFHLPIGKVWESWVSGEKLPTLLHDLAAPCRWHPYRVRCLHVVGPDEQDIMTSLAKVCREGAIGDLEKGGHRWVLNKDFLIEGSTPPKWNTQELATAAAIPRHAAIGHVQAGPMLLYGIHGRNDAPFLVKTTSASESRETRTSLEQIQKSLTKGELRLFTTSCDGGAAPKNEWLEFLEGSS